MYHWLNVRGLWKIYQAMRDCFGPTSLDEVAEEHKLTVRAAACRCTLDLFRPAAALLLAQAAEATAEEAAGAEGAVLIAVAM